MSTSNSPVLQRPPLARVPLRLRLATPDRRNVVDGGWWPQSRDLEVELADLVDHFPGDGARVSRALFSPPDWDSSPRRVPIARGYLKVGWFPGDDTHLLTVAMSDQTRLRILVIPSSFTRTQGEEALLAASTPRNAHTAGELLTEVTNQPVGDPLDHWTDDGGQD
ncbi:MAG TPA: DUF5994 family protein [Nocardioides sp.]|nr:DUF5994 family protein [Nocardioides sp.]